ncbi:AP-4 complex accessory subunit RUSC2 [Phycodurus eques]|uniref:AP-4 complex accessory subunit RUSC2 n=1 Tax=Phycodurus eques TaxID=693459 RepID=UPI002ACD96CD|nr:AP-4 complex accessory subunit RUSC2 [Phycodurus eques]XP_061555373.1 AP-4 complex accessory subunit RUSC2 [Phycodurus eques]XP_061555374.1 AP-4 complex accessory subunit RUSC2 [Phycodurus eques]XP_061555375.1 AP-4 complex accessory subunit RUSC2 [Phycodurus eques]
MIAASSVSGDTLIACHFPLLPLPAWQLPVQALCGSARRPGSSGLPRAASLPEQDRISQEHTIAISHKHFSNSFGSLNEDRVEEEEADASDCISTSSPEETGKEEVRVRGSQRSHNSFLPNPDFDEDDEDSDGDNLHKYHEDSSFVLHGTSTWHKSTDGNMDWGHEDLLQAQPLHIIRSSVMALNRIPNHVPCCIHNQHESSSEMLPNSQADYASDSSCGSSDGILVNFCTMYNRSNNPALPHDISSPAAHPSPSSEGSVFLNLQPLPSECDDQSVHSPLKPQELNSNCTLYPIEHRPPPGLSSLEVPDLAACLQSQAALVTGTNQTYYKLVTCDLSSQSPGANWSNVTDCFEDQTDFVSPKTRRQDHIEMEDQQREDLLTDDFQLASTSKEKSPSRMKDHIRNRCHIPCFLCFNHSCTCQSTNYTTAQEPLTLNQEQCNFEKGTSFCSNKPQRPTSLPIQPIVLGPSDKSHTKDQQLGCLVEHYMKQKNSKRSGSSQPDLKPKLKPSSLSNHCSIFMDACSSSDTCSTCTPSPDVLNHRNTWFQAHHSPRTSETSPDRTHTSSKLNQDRTCLQTGTELLSGLCQPKFVRIPTYQDLISLTTPKETRQSLGQSQNQSFFESILSDSIAQTNKPDHANPLPQTPEPQSFSLTSALASVAPLSSLGSLLSFAASGLQHQQSLKGITEGQHDEQLLLGDRPPTDLSPDTPYESLSISHLQRRGLLRSVSRAVDLIIAHFGNSRDPKEKMRLGNSYLSAMMASLVLDHLCPAIQNILEDGLRDHKLDVVIGQRRNSSWTVVEVSTKPGSRTKVLSSLVCKILNCPQLSSHSMRLKAYIMGLLNLRALEFWLIHLHSQKDVVTSHYHGWGFLSMSLGRCQPLFHELLLLLQPLSVLPFELDLLLEPRLLRNGQACPLGDCVSPIPPFAGISGHQTNGHLQDSFQNTAFSEKKCEVMQVNRSQVVFTSPEWRNLGECVVEGSGCSQNCLDATPPVSMDCREMEKDNGTTASTQVERPYQGGLRWAKLFGAANTSTRLRTTSQSQVKGCHRPSQWLHLDRSHLGLLTQSIRSLKP